MDVVDILGAEVFEEFFEELANIYTYCLNAILCNSMDNLENSQSVFFERF